ncbi:hypothetical protein [Bdellovibrio sp. HCB209]|uniref:hypothetical protein n=1 Tax=Bdellovibrio sp. HCB209 TaxID=3394354 RepID=UPI0039B66D2B
MSVFTAWSVGFASQYDDCCISKMEESISVVSGHEDSSAAVSIQEHPSDCANQCHDCVICQVQCNQHGLLSFVLPIPSFNIVQTHNSAFVHSYTDIDPTVLKQPPRA